MELNVGDSYTMTVNLMNVISSGGVDYGHPGVMYNVVEENNFDVVYFRLVSYGFQAILLSLPTKYKIYEKPKATCLQEPFTTDALLTAYMRGCIYIAGFHCHTISKINSKLFNEKSW